ncbi:C6 transcription factor [Cordyceps fumosorosea ARSEF 2679]|uniref:C6 transcription factor n=1 Tax=Cordyceps fumosorosea (strain ARSEF 2679) TaxID=1081104 RepID=A0A167YC10_CORFA|nr:C6 transcription factor [Cordyceps fumosorosea ARSEF 2679]OAA66141.1 C6 transcription factor [Cordyceps fumosorosea ARSEF 2679]
MGSLTTLESRPRMALPDTPPELASPTTTSLSSRSSPSADHVWPSQSLAALPMSSYDKTAGRDHGADDRREGTPPSASRNPQREQLPPLSSIFGPPSSMRPLSALPPPYPMHSPLSRPHLLAAPTQSPPPYLPSLAADPRAVTSSHIMGRSYSGSRSPRTGESRIDRGDGEQPQWPQQDAGRQQVEYVLDEPGASRRHLPESRDDATEYKNEAGGGGGSGTGTASESSVDKDALGPKIWAGTHYLPRFVRQAEVPGEGMCYFYDDGTHCKTVIDGERVNALWGVTKAGKPRKRLAIACVICREKKIKCDPDYPRCVQCDKFGRVCTFKTAPRGGHTTSPSAQPAELVHGNNAASSPRAASRSSRSPVAQPAAQSFEDGGNKRQKLGAGSYSPSRSREFARPDVMDHSKSPQVSHRHPSDASRIPDDVLARAWHTDVYASDPHSVKAITDVVTQFFLHADSAMLLKFLPETAWKAHVADQTRRKRLEDLMLLYSVLTLGMALSGGPKNIAFEYCQVAHYAQKNLRFDCLQLVQSRIILAAYYISVDRIYEANELLSSASAVAGRLQLTVELEKSVAANVMVYPFGMTRTGYKESRRRTLWSLFLLERFNGVFPHRSAAMINPEDLYIRLPTDDQSFEAQVERDEPLFDPYHPAPSSRLNVLAGLVEMAHLWSDCQATLGLMACRPAADEAARMQTLANKIGSWFTSLPENLSFSTSNLQDSAYAGSAGSFLSMHLLHHHAMIKASRHHPSAASLHGPQAHGSAARSCFAHARGIVDLLQTVERLRRTRPSSAPALLPRVAAAAVVEAVDVLNASGAVRNLPGQIDGVREALACFERLSWTWEDLARSEAAVRRRLDELLHILEQGPRPTGPSQGYRILETVSDTYWQIHEPINTQLPKEMDVVYTMPL